MRNTMVMLLLTLMVIVTGCSTKETVEHHYTYHGEDELWSAEYKIDASVTFFKVDGVLNVDTYKECILTVAYKKDISDLSKVKHLIISYDSSTGGGSIDQQFDNEPPTDTIYTLKSNSTGSAIESENEVIQVTINIDDEVQTIELTNTK